MDVFGVRLMGVTAETGRKVLLTVGFTGAIVLIRYLLARVIAILRGDRQNERVAFWARQGLSVASAVLILLATVSIWFDQPERLATGAGLVTAGLAFALQKVVTWVGGSLLILRGKPFAVGDRIKMGGVRGDVIALGFRQPHIRERGRPPPAKSEDRGMWVRARQ